MFVSALDQMCIGFSVLAFGARVTLLKSEEEQWGADAAYTVLSNLAFDQQSATMDAAAIDVAVDLLSATRGGRGTKKAFVFTDGFGTSGGLQLARALMRAREHRVEVVGLAVGPDAARTLVPKVN